MSIVSWQIIYMKFQALFSWKIKKRIIKCVTVNSEIFANSVKRHICGVKKSLLGHDLPISVNDRVISPFREDFTFTKLAYAK